MKRDALLALEQSRAALSAQLSKAQEDWNPGRVARSVVERYRWSLILTAAVAGFIAVRTMWPAFTPVRRTSHREAPKRSLLSFLLHGLWGMSREPLLALASQQLLPVLLRLISQFQTPQQPPASE
ncbi:MAG: hypothetical protein ACOYMN_13855 [Roseimicrobium sp.]